MKKYFLLVLFFNCAPKKIGMLCVTLCIMISMTIGSVFSQNPMVKVWDKRFGGVESEWLTCLNKTTDGGYILGGHSDSGISGDKTQATWGGYDYWIVKTDSLGNKQWDKNFGGTLDDRLSSIQQTSDGGFILGGYSESGISGNKTLACWGLYDYWIVKTDSLGIKQWEKDFGGITDDRLFSIQQTSDGGFILGGLSNSGISGNKSSAPRGGYDYWIVKTDSLGIKQWDKDFGGSGGDELYSMQQTSDGGFILGGYSASGIGGDKTQATWGNADYWIVKTDSLGSKQWDKDFGGTDYDRLFSIQQTSDGGFILGGHSESGISGDKTQPTWGYADYWIVKTDALGNKIWDKDFGGTDNEDDFGSVTITPDGGFLLGGTSYSNISGDKTEANLGGEQTWIVKTDSLGNKAWDKTVFTLGHDETGYAIKTNDPGCYLIANFSAGGIGGYKTQAAWNYSWDYWIVKFCETLQAGFTSTPLICPGTCVDFTNLSFNATSYQWSFSGATPPTSTDVNPTNICYPTPGSYDVQLIASNANGSDTLTLNNYITVYPTPPAQSITQGGDTLFAIAGSTSYQWYFNGIIINGATNSFYVATGSGDFNVVATDQNGCEVEAVINDVIANTFEVSGLKFEVYPNPVIDNLTIQKSQVKSGAAVELSIYNMMGEKVITVWPAASSQQPETSIDVSNLSSGLYYLEITVSRTIFRAKFVKE